MEIFTVDAFTSAPFAGNPAGVVLMNGVGEPEWMQRVAAELNFAETAFVEPGSTPVPLRWFTPAVEVDLCGHATLATAKVLFDHYANEEAIAFSTRSGVLRASRENGRIALDFPAIGFSDLQAPRGLDEILGARPTRTVEGSFGILAELESPDVVRTLTPDTGAMVTEGLRPIIVTARGGVDSDFTSRVFAPTLGIAEDSVTGSAHCMLGPYWRAQLGSLELRGHQVSRRGGYVTVRMHDDRVDLIGDAVIITQGELLV